MDHLVHDDASLAHDLRDFSALLLADPATREIVCRSIEEKYLAEEDEVKLLQFADAQPFMRRFHRKPNFERSGMLPKVQVHLARRYNPYIAIAVARNVAKGVWISVNDPRVNALISANMVPGDEVFDNTASNKKWNPRKLNFEEYYEVLVDAWSDKEFQLSLSKAIEARDKVGGDYWDREYWMPARDDLESVARKFMLRRGWTSNPKFWDYSMIIADHGVSIDDKEAVRALIASFHGEDVIDFGG